MYLGKGVISTNSLAFFMIPLQILDSCGYLLLLLLTLNAVQIQPIW